MATQNSAWLSAFGVCPNDGSPLEQEPTKNASDPGYGARCPKCGVRFDFKTVALQRLDSAASSAGLLKTALTGVRTQLVDIGIQSAEPVALKADLAKLEARLAEAEQQLATVDKSISDARSMVAGLLPDPLDLVYIKTARAEYDQLRKKLDGHIDEHGKALSNKIAVTALIVALIGVFVAVFVR